MSLDNVSTVTKIAFHLGKFGKHRFLLSFWRWLIDLSGSGPNEIHNVDSTWKLCYEGLHALRPRNIVTQVSSLISVNGWICSGPENIPQMIWTLYSRIQYNESLGIQFCIRYIGVQKYIGCRNVGTSKFDRYTEILEEFVINGLRYDGVIINPFEVFTPEYFPFKIRWSGLENQKGKKESWGQTLWSA